MTENSALRSLNPIGVVKEIADLAGVGELAQAGFRWIKMEAFRSTVGRTWFSDLFSIFEDPEALTGEQNPRAVPYSPINIAHVFYEIMRKALEFTAIAGEDLGSESIGEMLSEGLSSAMETNYNAALQTILNVWKGSLPPDLSVAQQIASRLSFVETKYALSQIAPVGALPQSILEAMVAGANQHVQQLLAPAEQQYLSLLQLKFEIMLSHIRAIQDLISDAIADLVTNLISVAENIMAEFSDAYTTLLERVTARLDDLEAAHARYTATTPLITEDEYNELLAEIEADANGLERSLNSIRNQMSEIADYYLSYLESNADAIAGLILDWLNSLEQLLVDLINDCVDAVDAIGIVSNLKSKITEIYEGIRAYRQSGFDYA